MGRNTTHTNDAQNQRLDDDTQRMEKDKKIVAKTICNQLVVHADSVHEITYAMHL